MDISNRNLSPPEFLPGSRSDLVFNALRVDTWIPKKVLADLIHVDITALSATLTTVRRTGWIEYRHTGNRVYEWRKRTQWDEPQIDIVSRSTKAHREKLVSYTEPTVKEHLEHARYHIEKAWALVGDIEAAQEALLKVRMHRR